MKKHWWCITYTLVLVLFTTYVALDTFVISQVYSVEDSNRIVEGGNQTVEGGNQTAEDNKQTDEDNANNQEDGRNEQGNTAENSESAAPSGEPEISDNSYSDENIKITITEYREYDSTIYVADVVAASPEYLKTAFAQGAYGKNVTAKTSAIAEDNGAILAVNGDFYGARRTGFVVRNGTLYRSSVSKDQEDLVIYKNGSFEIVTEETADAEALVSGGAQQVLSFGPALVMDRAISVFENEEVGKARTGNPRTAIGVIGDSHYLFVVSDGRTDESQGLTLYELAEFMKGLGAETAYNLDGGGSSTMYFNGRIINNPTTNGRRIEERSVSDIVFIGYE